MFENILGIILIIFIAVFSICSCIVTSWNEQELENEKRRKENEKKDLYGNDN